MVKSIDTELEEIEENKENANNIEKGEKITSDTSRQSPEKKIPSSNNEEEKDHGVLLMHLLTFCGHFFHTCFHILSSQSQLKFSFYDNLSTSP